MASSAVEREFQLRMRLFAQVDAQYRKTAMLTRADLVNYDTGQGFTGLIDTARGIRNPRSLMATLAVVSSTTGPYSDSWLEGGLFRYSYQGADPGGDNRKLRHAMDYELPIMLFLKPQPNDYVPIWPVYAVGDDPKALAFTLDISRSQVISGGTTDGHPATILHRRSPQAPAPADLPQSRAERLPDTLRHLPVAAP